MLHVFNSLNNRHLDQEVCALFYIEAVSSIEAFLEGTVIMFETNSSVCYNEGVCY